MNSEATSIRCPQCGTTIPPDAPAGLCPRCVLAGAAAPTDAGLKPGERVTAPSLETVAAAFPQLEILELVGLGGMGVVYKARQPKLDRLVALKLLPQSLSADPAFAERFSREARFLARLAHPNIVTVFDFGQSNGFCYLMMEFVDGVNLRQAMRAGRFSPSAALAIVPSICAALQYAHEQGVLHRDIKPENILLDPRGQVKIADFGIAKLVGERHTNLTLTESGARLGTPNYMAPEQIEHPADVDHRADIYSLGVVFYELLTGELPLGRFAPPSEKADLDARVDEIVFRALAKERELRQQSAGEVKTQVEGITSTPRTGQPGEPRPATASGLLKIGTSTFTTPERLATFEGQFFLHRTRGQLILDHRQITHSRAGVTTVIPLAAIRDLSIGRYPRAMNPWGINFVSVTYEEGGQTHRAYLSPMEGFFGLPTSWNQRVTEWFEAVRDAARAATGRTPGETPAERLGVPAGSTAIYVLYLLPIIIGVTLGVMFFVVLRPANPVAAPLTPFFLAGGVLIAFAAFAVGVRWLFKAPRAISVGLAGPDTVNPWPHRLFWLVLALVLLPVVAVMSWLLVPALQRAGFGPAASLLAGLLPMFVGGLMVWWFVRTRPTRAQAQPPGAWNPWPQRLFWVVLAVVATPALLLGLGLFLPYWLAYRAPRPVAPVAAQLSDSATPSPPLSTNGTVDARDSAGSHAFETRTFSLRHAQASKVVEDLQQILLGRPGSEARPGRDTTEVVVTAPADEMARAAALVIVTDFPDPLLSLRTHAFMDEEPLALARAFFYACAIEDYAGVERALSDREFVQLAGKDRTVEANINDTETAKLAAKLRTDWKEKDAVLKSFAAAWVRYPLRRLTLESGISMGFGIRHYVNASFDRAPKDFVDIALLEEGERDPQGHRPLRLDSRPPWWKATEATGGQASTASDSLRQEQDVQIRLARERMDEAQKRLAVGAISPLDAAAVERDLAVAEARADAVAIARANIKYAALSLEAAQQQHRNGKLTTLELHGAEATNEIARIQLEEALKGGSQAEGGKSATTDGPTAAARIAALRLDLAKQNLSELRKQVEVGAMAPTGREVLGAELAVAVAEAELRGDASAAARAQRDHADRILQLVEKMHEVGKATSAEVTEAKLAAATANSAVARLENRP